MYSIGNIDISDIDYMMIEKYQLSLYLQKPPLSKATIATYLRHLKVFIRFLESDQKTKRLLDQKIFDKDNDLYSERIKLPKSPRRKVDILAPEQLSTIFNAALSNENSHALGIRNALIIALMVDCGLRREEVIGLTRSRINFESQNMNVLGKGMKERIAPIGNFTFGLISEYINIVDSDPRYDISTDSLLFTYRFRPINDNTIKLMIHELSAGTGIKFSAHTLRHNFATNWCIDEYNRSGTIDIYRLQILLGHEDLKTTLIYVHMAEEFLIAASNVSHLDYINIADSLDSKPVPRHPNKSVIQTNLAIL